MWINLPKFWNKIIDRIFYSNSYVWGPRVNIIRSRMSSFHSIIQLALRFPYRLRLFIPKYLYFQVLQIQIRRTMSQLTGHVNTSFGLNSFFQLLLECWKPSFAKWHYSLTFWRGNGLHAPSLVPIIMQFDPIFYPQGTPLQSPHLK